MSDDHSDLADQRDAEADELEQEGTSIDSGIEDAKQALQATHDDALIPTPLGDEDATAQEETTADGEANAVDVDGAQG